MFVSVLTIDAGRNSSRGQSRKGVKKKRRDSEIRAEHTSKATPVGLPRENTPPPPSSSLSLQCLPIPHLLVPQSSPSQRPQRQIKILFSLRALTFLPPSPSYKYQLGHLYLGVPKHDQRRKQESSDDAPSRWGPQKSTWGRRPLHLPASRSLVKGRGGQSVAGDELLGNPEELLR